VTPPDPDRHGWGLVSALAAAQLVSWGSLTYSFSLLVIPMEAELGWGRTQLNGALSLGLLAAGLLAYAVGAAIDRGGGRWVMSLGSALGAALLAGWAMVDSLSIFYVIWIGLGAAIAASLYEPVFAVVTQLFPASFRTKITAITLVAGFASTLFMPLTQMLIGAYGWRHALLLLAMCMAVVCLPIHVFALPKNSRHQRSELVSRQESRAMVRRAAGTRAFWGLLICFTAYYGTFNAMIFHMVPMLTERGFSPATMIGAIAVIGPAQVAGRVALLVRRPRSQAVGGWVIALFTLAVGVLALGGQSLVALYVFAVLFGAANGIMTILRGTAVPDLLWREGYGAINGALSMPAMAAKAAAPFAAALIWEMGQSYDAVLWTVIGGGVVAMAGFRLAVSRSA